MLNDLFRTYKKIILAVVLLLSAIIFWFFGCHRTDRSQTEGTAWEQVSKGVQIYNFHTEHITGDITFGTAGYLSADRTQPVVMNVSGKKGSFAGTIKITLPGEDGKGVAYQSAVRCEEGVPTEVILSIPLLGNVSFFSVEILDQFGTEELAEMIVGASGTSGAADPDDAIEKKSFYIGVLSDEYERLEWINDLELEGADSNIVLHLLRMDQRDLWSNVKKLQSLSGILVDDYDTSSLSQRQKNCLKDWVEEGGSLLAGTGERAEWVISGINNILDITAGNEEQDSLQFYGDEESAGYIALRSNHFKLEEDQWQTDSLSHPASCYTKQYGKGKVMVLTWSLTDEALKQWTGREKMAQELFGNFLSSEYQSYSVDDDSTWYLKKALYSFLNSQTPNTFYYALFFITYLAALVFFAYYLLRRIRKRENIWVVVPVISLLFTVFLMIRTGGFGGGSYSSFSALKVIDTAQEGSRVYFLYQNNEGESSTVDLNPEVQSVKPMDYSYRTGNEDVASLRRLVQDYTINNTQNGYDIAFGEAVPGTSQLLMFTMDDGNPISSGECFQMEMEAELTSFQGSITNLSGYHFDKIILIRGNQYRILDDVDSGQSIKISSEDVLCWSGYDQENSTYDQEESHNVVSSLVEYLRYQYMNNREDFNAVVAAGITNEKKISLFADDHSLQNYLTIFVNRYALPSEEHTYYISDINGDCLSREQKQSTLTQDILEENKTEAVYQFDSDKVVWNLARNRDSFEGTIYAYNYETGKNEKILEKWDDTMNCQELEPYVSGMNKMTLIFRLKKDQSYGGAPVLSLVLKDVKQ